MQHSAGAGLGRNAANLRVNLRRRLRPFHKTVTLAKLGGVHALTDVTGFGLLGHGLELATRARDDGAASDPARAYRIGATGGSAPATGSALDTYA